MGCTQTLEQASAQTSGLLLEVKQQEAVAALLLCLDESQAVEAKSLLEAAAVLALHLA